MNQSVLQHLGPLQMENLGIFPSYRGPILGVPVNATDLIINGQPISNVSMGMLPNRRGHGGISGGISGADAMSIDMWDTHNMAFGLNNVPSSTSGALPTAIVAPIKRETPPPMLREVDNLLESFQTDQACLDKYSLVLPPFETLVASGNRSTDISVGVTAEPNQTNQPQCSTELAEYANHSFKPTHHSFEPTQHSFEQLQHSFEPTHHSFEPTHSYGLPESFESNLLTSSSSSLMSEVTSASLLSLSESDFLQCPDFQTDMMTEHLIPYLDLLLSTPVPM